MEKGLEFGEASLAVMRSLSDYPPGLIGTVATLFGQTMARTHGVDWTLDAMIAEQQCEFFRRFDSARDRVWVAMINGQPRGALTIDGPRPELQREGARLRFFILDHSLRGYGLGRTMLTAAMEFCREQRYPHVFLTTLPTLQAAGRLYAQYGFVQVASSSESFHGSHSVEQTLECNLLGLR
jgi:GNAT superfamily N-acetyltransferase